MAQGFGDLDIHRLAQRTGPVQTVFFRRRETFRRLLAENVRVSVVGLHQDLPLAIAYQVRQVFLVGFQRGDMLCIAGLFTVADFQHGQRQDALRGFFQRAVERLVQLMLHHQPGAHRRPQPEQGHAQCQADAQALLQA